MVRVVSVSLFLLLLHGVDALAQVPLSQARAVGWETKANLPIPLYAHQLVAIDGRLYAVGGRTEGENGLSALFEYAVGTDEWREKTGMRTGRANHAAVAVEGRVHVVGGDRFKSTHEIYDPVDDVWSVGQPLPVGSQHLNYSAAPGQGGFFIFGGLEEGAHVSQRVLRYDLEAGVWEERAPLPSPRQSAAAINFNGVIFVFGGIDERMEGVARTDAYDPTTDAWERKADMPEARMVSGAAVVGDEIVVVAGIMLEETTSEVFLYDPHTDEWLVGPALPYPLTLAGVASVGNSLYVAGGTDRETIFSQVLEGVFPEMR